MPSPTTTHVNDSIQPINLTTWLIGSCLLLTHHPSTFPSCPPNPDHLLASWNDTANSLFTLSPVPPGPNTSPQPPFHLLHPSPTDDPVPLVYTAGDTSANLTHPTTTREHVTLAFVQGKKREKTTGSGLGFEIPEVLYHCEWDGQYFLVVPPMPGRTLTEGWPGMDEETRGYYVSRVAEVCGEMAEWKGEEVAGRGNGSGLQFHLSAGMDFPDKEDEYLKADWRRRVSKELAARGFKEVIQG
ncbi:hypothetical protein C8A05DRAFT_37963 [Staphylotrichum tortipilum]|uniref:Uncharacterized protein n=1 Tax=Staphylotrichum tortipilum TaxID=2831512 RepID=A0AAN6RPB0_9PEZI|nr:hypothetical protein C8A05DRAFT_37963 [Staphylotrichum longicolle]